MVTQRKEEQLQWREQELERLKLLLAQLRRMQFGRKSEKLARQIEQLELRLEGLGSQRAEAISITDRAAASSPREAVPSQKPGRRPLPSHLPLKIRKRLSGKMIVCSDSGFNRLFMTKTL